MNTEYFKNPNEIKGHSNILKLANEWQLNVEAQCGNLSRFFEKHYDRHPLFQKSVFHGKMAEGLAYKDDGNTRTQGTEWDFYLGFPFHDTVIDNWQFSAGTLSFVLAWHMNLHERNYDGKVFYSTSNCICYGSGKGTRIDYTTNSHLINLSVSNMADIVDIINQTLTRISLENKLKEFIKE